MPKKSELPKIWGGGGGGGGAAAPPARAPMIKTIEIKKLT